MTPSPLAPAPPSEPERRPGPPAPAPVPPPATAPATAPDSAPGALAVFQDARFFSAQDGCALHVTRWLPRGPARAVTVASHGIAEDARTLRHLGMLLAARGIACWGLDLRGFGRSGGERGDVEDFEQLVADLAAVAAHAADSHPRRPVFLAGHSAGGMIATLLYARQPTAYRGLVTSCSPFRFRRWLGKALAGVKERAAAATTTDGHAAGRLTLFPTLAREGAESDGTVTRRFGTAFEAALGRIAALDSLGEHVLHQVGGDDPVVDTEASHEFFARVRHPDATVHVYPGRRHALWHAADRDPVLDDVLTWLEARIEQ